MKLLVRIALPTDADFVPKVYQERVLSPRILNFADKELIWGCCHVVDCECGFTEIKKDFDRARIFDEQDDSISGDMDSSSQPAQTLDQWSQVVKDYTSLSLTYPTDALPALSGIAKVFAAKTQDEYVAGMWKRTLVSQLLWYFWTDHGNSIINVKPWRAPSWSWVSMKWAPSPNYLPVTQELAEVKDVLCQPSGVDLTGALATAHLTLSTKVIPARMELCPNRQNSNGPDSDLATPEYLLHLDCGFTIAQASSLMMHNLEYFETSFLCLSDPRLTKGIASLNVAVAQVAASRRESLVYLHGVLPNIDITQEVQSYLLLAKDVNDNARWVRIGHVGMTVYDPNLALYGYSTERLSYDVQKSRIQQMTKQEIEAKLEESRIRNRKMFRLFDESETQDSTIW